MNKPDFTQIAKTMKLAVKRHTPEILTGIGIAGMVTSTVLAVKATPKALELIESAEVKKHADMHGEYHDIGREPLTALETVKAAWKPYVPAVVTSALSVGCLIGGSAENARRNAALATAYQLSQTALSDYKEKVIETIGEKKEKAIKDKIAKDKVEKDPVDTTNVIITGKGTTLCYDAVFGQYFESDIETIKKAINNLNYRMLGDQYVSLNDFYDEIGVERIDVGEMVGWNISKHGMIEVEFSSQIAKDGRPCIVLQYYVAPDYNYYKTF